MRETHPVFSSCMQDAVLTLHIYGHGMWHAIPPPHGTKQRIPYRILNTYHKVYDKQRALLQTAKYTQQWTFTFVFF